MVLIFFEICKQFILRFYVDFSFESILSLLSLKENKYIWCFFYYSVWILL